MTKTFLLITIIALLIGCGTQKNSTAPDKNKVVVKRILLLGGGPAISRIFLENLSEDMIGVLKGGRVVGDFKFMENIKPGYRFDANLLDSLDYDAYIVFLPFDKAVFELNQPRKIPLPLWHAYVYGFTPNSYKQTFTISTYVKTDKLKMVWDTSFSANFDFTEKEKYKPITNDIISTLYKDYFSLP